MRLVIFLGFLLLSIGISAEPAYTFYDEKDASEVVGKAVIQSDKGWYYVGEIKNGVPHGNGVKIANEGMVLYGEWVDGELGGEGAIYTPAPFNALEAGTYKKNKISGEGVVIIGGEAYQGPYGRLGLPDGEGVCIKAGVKKVCTYDHGAKIE